MQPDPGCEVVRMRDFIKKLIFRYTVWGAPRYDYNISPLQCAAIINALEELRGIDGTIVEVGVARGMTSRFIAEYLRSVNSPNRFFCIDTFESFMPRDIRYEVEQRGKNAAELKGFAYNDFNRWRRNFSMFECVTAIRADASNFDFGIIAPIKFMFLDCDLYLPTLNALHNVTPYLADNFVVLVDDVRDRHRWDGAFEAFTEYSGSSSHHCSVIGGNCGVIRPMKTPK